MKDYTVKNPKFSESVKIIETTDAGHADNVNVSTEQLLQNTLVNKKGLDDKVDKEGDVSNTTATFSQADTRENIKSGEKLSVIFGKIMKMFSDIKNAAFYSVINNLLTTQAGVGVLDAYQGKVLKDLYDTLNGTVTQLNKNIITGGSKSFTVTEAGAWYRLGYVEKNSNFYGEFVITHNWNNNVPVFVKLLVAGGCNSVPSFYVKEILQTYQGCGTGDATHIKNKMIKKARVIAYPGGSSNYNIYVDVFIQDTGAYIQESNNWIYKLSTELNPFGFKWVDCAFGEASIPSGLVAREFSLA